jgi:hypothetical protein
VKKYCKKIQSAYPNKFYNLNDIAEFHDKSKFVEPERTPYISLTWKKFVAENSKDNEKFQQKPKSTKEENEATVHHIISNSHHPEYWCGREINLLNTNDRDKSPSEIVDATKMPDINIAEMVADWCAMSEELDNSPFDWASMNINKRWYFNGNQIALIYKLLEVVWDVNIKDNNKNNVNINNKNNIKDNNKDNVNIEDKNIDIKNIDYISKNIDLSIDNNIIHNINNTINNIDISSAKSLGGNVGNADDAYIKDELEKGIDVELEHTPKKEIAKEIAKDHLDEIPDYYTRLIKMEEEAMKLKKDKEASSEVNNNFQSELAYVKAKAKEVDEYLRQRIVEYQEEGISEEEYFDKIEQEIFTKYHLNSETYSLLMKHL